jgi:asparagine synthase (glutamine-hydrolysing)
MKSKKPLHVPLIMMEFSREETLFLPIQLYTLGETMCGVIAIFSPDFSVSPGDLKNGINAIYHRGPDSNNYWISNTKKVGLGHARLSIIDLSMGKQPLKSSNGRIWAVVNGELYGHKEIRKKMRVKGYKFYTNSDSEIIIALYQEYGIKLFAHLTGEFSFILWDEEQQQLIAARDRFGIKPLFYSKVKNNFYFASEIKALIAMGIKPVWNLETVIQLESETKPVVETLFKDVYSIAPSILGIGKRKLSITS